MSESSDYESDACFESQDLTFPYAPLSPPILRRLASFTIFDEKAAIDLDRTSVTLCGIIHELFPNDLFSITPSAVVGAYDTTLYDVNSRRWLRYSDPDPSLDHAQRLHALVTFLNLFTRNTWLMYAEADHRLPTAARQWTVTESTRLTSDGTFARVKGIALTEPGGNDVQWKDVLGDVLVADSADQMPELIRGLSSGAANVFATQENRLFHIGLALAGSSCQLVYFDRAGRGLSDVLDIHRNAVTFARVLMGLGVLDDMRSGRDASIYSRDQRRFVTVDSHEYEIMETLAASKKLRGRGTICWRCRARDSEEDVVIKNVWADMGHSPTEGELLRRASGVTGVIDLIAEEVIKQPDGQPWRTTWIRQRLQGSERPLAPMECLTLELRRLVLKTYVRPLADFSCKEELVRAFYRSILTHLQLYERKDILHCDISENNIMLRAQAGSRLREGILIDFDCALLVKDLPICPGRPKVGYMYRTRGTLPFMSYDALCCSRSYYPGPWDDLESFLYVLMWICTNYSGPRMMFRQGFDLSASPMGPWLTGGCQHKWSVMYVYDDERFRAFLDSVFDPYFDDLKDLVCDLRSVIMHSLDKNENRAPAEHHSVLMIVDHFIRKRWPTAQDPSSIPRASDADGIKDTDPLPSSANTNPTVSTTLNNARNASEYQGQHGHRPSTDTTNSSMTTTSRTEQLMRPAKRRKIE
ncbi:hypothetical protein HDZ31DRAFT_67463 [Schizophyllum fasciatum]